MSKNLFTEVIQGKSVSLSMWGFSSAGRAPALHAGGQEFESPNLQIKKESLATLFFSTLCIFFYVMLNLFQGDNKVGSLPIQTE